MNPIKKEYEPLLKKVLKPGRYTGGELGEVIKPAGSVDVRFVFAFPDLYEIGMSNLGLRILYGVLNSLDYVWCERAFAPWPDMGEALKKSGVELYALESGDSLRAFDIIGFTLQYELCYTNVLYMLELAGIPCLASERGEGSPLIIGGGPCTFNPEPFADFFDLLVVGEGEEVIVELAQLYRSNKLAGGSKAEFLRAAARLGGVYVPSLYAVNGGPGPAISSPCELGAPERVKKRVIADFDAAYFPTAPIVPFIETVHDRIMLEVFRGCARGCRFCQAGMTGRPVREKKPETLDRQARELYINTGYGEISLSSLSISDYSHLRELCGMLCSWTNDAKINLSLPSMRVDAFSRELADVALGVRGSTLTFAPEAGTQRLRDAIKKNLTEEEILTAANIAFAAGKSSVKLYFMIGLPGETDEDITGIAELAKKVVGEFYKAGKKGRDVSVTLSVAAFVPKPFTPFQFEGQDSPEELRRKQALLVSSIKSRKIKCNYHGAETSRLEAAFARGDRRLSAALLEARVVGLCFDGWDEHFKFGEWRAAFERAGLDMDAYAGRSYACEERLPWDFIDVGVSKAYLIEENKRSKLPVPPPVDGC